MTTSTPAGVAFLVDVCREVSTPLSARVTEHVRKGEWDSIAGLRIDPRHYDDSEVYWADAQVASLLRKLQELPTSHDREAVAVENFWKSERQCYRTNQRLGYLLDPSLYPEGYYGDGETTIRRVLRRARKIVRDVLGRCPVDLELSKVSDEEIEVGYSSLEGRFGPGATFGDTGKLCTVPDKMTSNPTLTTGCWPFIIEWAGTLWATAAASAGRRPSFVPGNRFTTVPKDCEKDRGIAVEPSLNVFYQLSLGALMKQRLKDKGLDLKIGQEVHRRVACEASVTGAFATIDLSNASDTVSKVLVRLLLPHRWYSLLESLRSPKTLVGGRWIVLEKFSSMGNGFTFELETLLFAAISKAVVEDRDAEAGPSRARRFGRDIFVYGDDIIVPTQFAQEVLAVLRFLGFTPNDRKTFVDGPFRESCGGDFFRGVAVTPHYLEDDPREPQHYIALANGLRRACAQKDNRWRIVRRAWFRAINALPTDVRRCRGPEDLGDIVIHDDESRWATSETDQRTGSPFLGRNVGIRFIRSYQPVCEDYVEWKHFRPEVQLACAVLGVGDGRRGVLPRRNGGKVPDGLSGYRLGWVPFS